MDITDTKKIAMVEGLGLTEKELEQIVLSGILRDVWIHAQPSELNLEQVKMCLEICWEECERRAREV
jgi:hypothetical protein